MEPALGVIISLALVVAAFGGRTKTAPITPSLGSDEVRVSAVTSRGHVLSIGPQKSGTEISIDTLVLEESANLGVFRTEEGKSASLALIKLPKGSYQKLIVSLDKPTKSGDTLVLALMSRKTSQPLLDGRGEEMTRKVSVTE